MDKDLRELCSRKAFLFDFDGVITDSEPYVFEVLKQMIKDNFGIELPYSDINMTIGCSDRKVAEYIANEYHIDYSVELSEKLKKNYPFGETEEELSGLLFRVRGYQVISLFKGPPIYS